MSQGQAPAPQWKILGARLSVHIVAGQMVTEVNTGKL